MHLFFPIKGCLLFECPRSMAEDDLNVGCFCWCWKKSNFTFFCITCHLVSFSSREKWAAIVTVSVIGVFLKLDIFSSNGTCQMRYEQLAYQTITVLVCCLLWFQHASQDSASWCRYLSVCGFNELHTMESQTNNRPFFLFQLLDFGKGFPFSKVKQSQVKQRLFPGNKDMIYNHSINLILIFMCHSVYRTVSWHQRLTGVWQACSCVLRSR